MIDPKKLEEIAKQIHNALPPGIRSMGEEVEKKTRQVLQAQLNKLDLVSREEFDVQTKVLLRTREKLTALEAKLAQLEQQLEDANSRLLLSCEAASVRADQVDRAEADRMVEEVFAVVAAHHGDYDGWAAPLVQG